LRSARVADQWQITRLILRHQLNVLGIGWENFTVAVDEHDQFVGCGQIKSHGEVDELASLVVVDEWQGKGVAKLLMDELIARSRRPLWLMCESPLTPYYTGFGFREVQQAAKLPNYFQSIYWATRLALGLVFLARGTYVAFMVLDSDKTRGQTHAN
jgi:N-acetylglutamate synthase-like GNAT family acetyltransferase